jgi:hypothetical protein
MEAIHRYRTFKAILFNYPPSSPDEAKFLQEIKEEFQTCEKNTRISSSIVLGLSSMLWLFRRKYLYGLNSGYTRKELMIKLFAVSTLVFVGGGLAAEYDNCANLEHYLMQISISRLPVATFIREKLDSDSK